MWRKFWQKVKFFDGSTIVADLEKYFDEVGIILTIQPINFDGLLIFLTAPSKYWKSTFVFWPVATHYSQMPSSAKAPRPFSAKAKLYLQAFICRAISLWLWAVQTRDPFLFLHKCHPVLKLESLNLPKFRNISLNLSGAGTRRCCRCWSGHTFRGMHHVFVFLVVVQSNFLLISPFSQLTLRFWFLPLLLLLPFPTLVAGNLRFAVENRGQQQPHEEHRKLELSSLFTSSWVV